MAKSGSPNAIGLGRDFVYNSTMTKRLQRFMAWLENIMRDTELRWLTLILSVFWILVFYAVGLSGLAQIIALVYIMYFVTFWRRRD